MRLRSVPLLVLIVAVVAAVGAWADKPHVAVADPPKFVPAQRPWDAIVEISRHGRRLDGFRPVVTISGPDDPRTFAGKAIGIGRYRVEVVFPHPGAYTYTVVVANRVALKGSVTAIPR